VPINNRIPHEADHERRMIPDETVTEEVVRVITEHGPRATFVQLDEVDGAGHSGGFHPGNPDYLEAVAVTDAQVGQMLDAITARKEAHPGEEWLVIIVSDHGGTEGGSHGGLTPEEIIVPYFMIGDGVEAGELAPTVYNVDAPITALAFLGIEIDPAWEVDGIPRGLAER
jgi:bisphosphoglycerate-independent phosphoglycerate mutase (AlkP superfamily)